LFCSVVHRLLSEHLREGYDLHIILHRVLVQQFFTLNYHRLVCYGCGLGCSLVKEVLCCSCCIYIYIYVFNFWKCDCLEGWHFTHMWMVLAWTHHSTKRGAFAHKTTFFYCRIFFSFYLYIICVHHCSSRNMTVLTCASYKNDVQSIIGICRHNPFPNVVDNKG